MKEYDICENCPDEDTSVCDTCEKRKCRVCGCTWNDACPGGCYWVEFDLCSRCIDTEAGGMELTYTFHLTEGISCIEGLHDDLDRIIKDAGLELVKSSLESPDEICEHDSFDDE